MNARLEVVKILGPEYTRYLGRVLLAQFANAGLAIHGQQQRNEIPPITNKPAPPTTAIPPHPTCPTQAIRLPYANQTPAIPSKTPGSAA